MVDKLLTDDEVLKISGKNSMLLTYPQLYNYYSIDDLFNNDIKKIIILYLHDHNKGHWCLLTKYDNQKKVSFFDPYGLMPDQQLKWNDKDRNYLLNQHSNYLTLLLYQYDGKVEYNDYKFQKFEPHINTCGRWIGIRSRYYLIPLDIFIKQFENEKNNYGIDLDNLIVEMTDEILNKK